QFLDQWYFVGSHHRHARERQLQGRSARFCQRRTRVTKSFVLFIDISDHARLDPPRRNGRANCIGKSRHSRHNNLDRTELFGNASNRSSKYRRHPTNFPCPASRQHQKQGRISHSQTLLKISWTQVVKALDERMAHVAARRSAQLTQDLWLERQ